MTYHFLNKAASLFNFGKPISSHDADGNAGEAETVRSKPVFGYAENRDIKAGKQLIGYEGLC